jgi:hypothetical protein
MEVGDRLTHDVVDRDERPLRLERLDQRPSDALSADHKRLHEALRQIEQRFDMPQRGDEDMSFEDRSVIEKCDHVLSAQHDRRIDIATADLAEDIVSHRHETSAIQCVDIVIEYQFDYHVLMSTPAYAPPGWPSAVQPPGVPGWEESAIAYLLDCCPADFRAYRVLRNHPVVLAQFAMHFVNGQQEASERGLADVRTSLSEYVEPDIVEAATQAWLEQAARLVLTRRAVGLLDEALRGRVFVRKL